MPVLQAKVKGVQSGDTLILTNPRGLERTLSLAYVSAPRLRREGDEVWQNPAEFRI
jgi:staphylococcal nuclease domain-containing protein 1